MRYRLSVLTHGESREVFSAVGTFLARVHPDPVDAVIYYDGLAAEDRARSVSETFSHVEWSVSGTEHPQGFCGATRALWRLAADRRGADYVFWLEHDFEIVRKVNLAAFAAVLDLHPPCIAQVQLMRDAVNSEEVAAGGLYQLRRDEYTRCTRTLPQLDYLEHRSYFTTNPSLMRRDFMQRNPWPADYPYECEGRFGIDLSARGYSYAVAGSGEPWCSHIGTRNGFGY